MLIRLQNGKIRLGNGNQLWGRNIIFEASGGIKTIVGDYTIHTFIDDGEFITNKNGAVDVLVIGGGGGAGGGYAGAGGAGGFIIKNNFEVLKKNYNVVIGVGGSGHVSNGKGMSGGNSIFDIFTAAGGGGGAGYDSLSTGIDGGSGGGSGVTDPTPGQNVGIPGLGNVPTVIPPQGYAGGQAWQAYSATTNAGGGGGGAGGVGGQASLGIGGNGGLARFSDISGISKSYAGGGGGGSATVGLGGGTSVIADKGGAADGGTENASGQNAISNTGGGGGSGSGVGGSGGSGGSGIVIIRYLTDPTYYNLIVNDGSGDGRYLENTIVPISGDLSGTFINWTGDTSSVVSLSSEVTTVTMINNIELTANYSSIPPIETNSWDDNMTEYDGSYQ